ncbi:MAG: MFS transporter, partial [Candidatus Hydrothermota bacterium]
MKIDELVPMLIPPKAQRKFLILCALGWIAVAAGVMLIPFTLPAIITQWNLSAMEAGTLASATFMG